MTRSAFAMCALAFAASQGCNIPVCGTGTKQVQKDNGEVRCELSEQPPQLTQCDVDGGAIIAGGMCTGRKRCGDNTTEIMQPDGTVVCEGRGGTGCSKVCPTQSGSSICLTGQLYDFLTNMPVKQRVKFAYYDPLTILSNPQAPPQQFDINEEGCYVFTGLTLPASKLVAIGVDDPDNAAMDELMLVGVGAQTPVGGRTYKIDAYRVPKTLMATWRTETGFNYEAEGMYISLYHSDAAIPDDFTIHEKNPVSGVKIVINGVTPVEARYFGASRASLDPTLMATSAVGGASVPGSVFAGAIANITGMGGTCNGVPCNYPASPGSTVAGILFMSRFHHRP